MRVAFIGPPYSGKTTLFAAIAEAGGSKVDVSRPDQPHLAVVKVPDERLTWLTGIYKPQKEVPAEIELLDMPGVDLADAVARALAQALGTGSRQRPGGDGGARIRRRIRARLSQPHRPRG